MACGEDLEDPEPPERPQWVAKSLPTDTIETGIDAYHLDDAVVLEWYPGTEADLAEYKIFCALNEPDSTYELLQEITFYTLTSENMVYLDTAAQTGNNYYYYLKAVDQTGNKSEPSDTQSYQLIQKAELIQPRGALNETRPVFEWYDHNGRTTNEYVIRLECLKNQEVIWISRMNRPNYGDFSQSKEFNFDQSSKINNLIPGNTYRWRIDAIYMIDNLGYDVAGSESYWEYFSIQDAGS